MGCTQHSARNPGRKPRHLPLGDGLRRLSEAQDVLRALIDHQGSTGGEVARRIGVSQSLLSRWRKGRSVPSAENLARLRALLGEEGE